MAGIMDPWRNDIYEKGSQGQPVFAIIQLDGDI
jgi:hypothetical protein